MLRCFANLMQPFALAVVLGLAPIVLLAADEPKSEGQQAGDLPKGDAERGAKLYSRYCRGCHGEEGRGDGLVFMPHVNNLTKKGYIENLPDDYLVLAINKGGPGIGKSDYMPAWEGTLSQEQVSDLVAFIRSLPTY